MKAIPKKLFSYCQMKHYFHDIFRDRKFVHTASQLAESKGWEPVIGLEIHAQILAKSKLFSGAGTSYGKPANCQVAFIDCALPGTLPVLNQRCVEAGLITALALDCNINKVSYFDRKHYFYADMPSGYQITQQRQALAQHGKLTYLVNGKPQEASIFQLQLEQDSGKSFHDPDSGVSLIDLNRAGVGLMEIVTNPDFRTASDTRAFVKELQLLLTILDTCTCTMAEGKMRVDASVSLHRPNEPLGTRCEVKNLNSLGFLEKAVDYEIKRQLDILESEGTIENETRTYNSEEGKTVPMRDKEKVHDYRFMPEPNLLPLRLYDNSDIADVVDHTQIINIDAVKEQLPMLPMARREKLISQFNLPMIHANQIVNTPGYWELFHELCDGTGRSPRLVTVVFIKELAASLKQQRPHNTDTSGLCIDSSQVADVIDLLADGKISRKISLMLFSECILDNQLNVRQTVVDRGLILSYNVEEIKELVTKVLLDDANTVKKARSKKRLKEKLTKILIMRAMESSHDKYDINLVSEAVREQLS